MGLHGMLTVRMFLFALFVLLHALPALSQRLSDADMIEYLTQAICVDPSGKPTAALPIADDCRHTRPQHSEDTATYRKHDWPNSLAAPETVKGYQASDSVLRRRGSRTLIVQTFDFGNADRVFGRFDGGRGDGGQVLMLVDGWSSVAMTEDGGGGVQWFIGEACRASAPGDRRFVSWLVFRNEVSGNAWKSVLARLNIAPNPDSCPRQFNPAFTRYRLDRVEFPFRIVDGDTQVKSSTRVLDVVVSEHYGGTDIESADHLERFFFARRLGLVRWERWSNGNVSRQPGTRDSAAQLAQTARCPRLERYAMPSRNWLLVDCRTWTTLVRQTRQWSVDGYGWDVLKQFDRLN